MIAFDGVFTVPGSSDEVMQRFTDVRRMATCLPGATLEEADADDRYPGSVTVAFGPKKIKFSGLLECDFNAAERTGTLIGRGATTVRSARASIRATFQVMPSTPSLPGGEPQSRVSIHSEAEFGGILAEFAKTGGVAVATVLMNQFSENVTAEFVRDKQGPVTTGIASAPLVSPPRQAESLSMGRLLWQAIWQMLRTIFHARKPAEPTKR
jgi:carbon monoxide dehydrogenase subunit G